MRMDVVGLLAGGYLVGLLAWPWRKHLGSNSASDASDVMDARFLWAFMFACIWPYLLVALVMMLADRAWHRIRGY